MRDPLSAVSRCVISMLDNPELDDFQITAVDGFYVREQRPHPTPSQYDVHTA